MTHGLLQRIEDRARRVWRKHLFHRLPEERGGRRAEPLRGWCVVPVDAPFGINLEHEIRKRGQRRVKVRARLPKSFLGCLEIGDVARCAPPHTRRPRFTTPATLLSVHTVRPSLFCVVTSTLANRYPLWMDSATKRIFSSSVPARSLARGLPISSSGLSSVQPCKRTVAEPQVGARQNGFRLFTLGEFRRHGRLDVVSPSPVGRQLEELLVRTGLDTPGDARRGFPN
jgi:hypothetical protein